MYAHERNLILMFLHSCRNYETALISCLIVFIIFVCGIVVFICVCSTARTGGCQIGPNGSNTTILEYYSF